MDVARPHDGTTKCSLSERFLLDFSSPKQVTSLDHFHTKSGRRVKCLFDSYHGNVEHDIIQDLDYDDELDVLVVLYLDVLVKDGAVVAFIDNQTGHILHKFGIMGMSEEGEHSIAVDRNNLVILSKNNNTFKCTVYTLHNKVC